jgi:hypothetical protein
MRFNYLPYAITTLKKSRDNSYCMWLNSFKIMVARAHPVHKVITHGTGTSA